LATKASLAVLFSWSNETIVLSTYRRGLLETGLGRSWGVNDLVTPEGRIITPILGTVIMVDELDDAMLADVIDLLLVFFPFEETTLEDDTHDEGGEEDR
jgi:hypothetical protein